MPLTLTTPIAIQSTKTESRSELKITEFTVKVEESEIQVKLAVVDGSNMHNIPGMLVIRDTNEDTTMSLAGQTFNVTSGTYYTDAVGTDHSGTNVYERVKTGLYQVLDNMFGLSGSVS